ncbi:LOW QUALITY PROTEIN: complement component C9-like [Sarcoramphus papa]
MQTQYTVECAVLTYDTKADKTFTSEFYHDCVKMLQEVYIEKQKYFNADMSLKYTPTEGSNKNGSEGNFKYHYSKNTSQVSYSKNTSLSSILKSFTERNQTFLHVKGKIHLGRFQIQSRDVHLTDSFLDDLNFLPAEYDKGEYFKFLQDYGTHYVVSGTVGGKYELVYVLDDYAISQIGITVEDVKRCLGYHLDANIAYKDLNANVNINGDKCEKINVKDNSELKDDAVISLVDGGKIDFSVKIKEMLLQGSKMVDIEDYIQWAKSFLDAPVVIQQRPSLIYTLVPVKMRNAYLKKKQNLERAIEDYVTEYSACKCEPCKNGGTLVLVDGAFICMCSSYFKGIACQIPKSTLTKVVTDGGWSCSSAWFTCINGESTQTRLCNNPTPEPGGRPCQVESIEKRSCREAK